MVEQTNEDSQVMEMSEALTINRDELDPITVEVIRHKLDGIADEMQTTLLRSSFSPIVKEGLDASASLFTADGTTLAQSCSIPIHLATLIPCVEQVIKTYGQSEISDGDIYIINDPYGGGTHLPDIAIIVPIFVDEELIAFSAAMAHHQDVGGKTPGSVPTDATELYQEGLCIPLVRLSRRGAYDDQIIRFIRKNVRIPDVVMGDINAQIAACSIARRRISEVSAMYGRAYLTRVFGNLIDRSELLTRKALEGIPDGVYNFVDYLDNDGIDLDKKIRIEVTATVKGDELNFDFAGTDAQVKGPLNCVYSGTLAAACFVVRAATGSNIPTNGGCFKPLSISLPPGTVVNPNHPAPVNARTATIKRITGTMLAALAKAVPDKVPASNAGELLVIAFGGRRADTNESFIVTELIAGGSGASQYQDGVDVVETDATNCMNMPVEAMEVDAPVRVIRAALRDDSGGVGQHRGGLGVIREYEALQDGITVSHRGERHFTAAAGLNGGGSGAVARSVVKRRDGSREEVRSKEVLRLDKGDVLLVETAGGGGYGKPQERSKTEIEEDLMNGKVSNKAALEVYGH